MAASKAITGDPVELAMGYVDKGPGSQALSGPIESLLGEPWCRHHKIVGSAMKRGLDPIVSPESRVLILGTMPGDESLRLGQYYAHPKNQFWQILSRVYDETIAPEYRSRVAFLEAKGLALWDVLKTADRPGSLDSDIRGGVPNDFATLFREHPRLRVVAFNGQKAEKLFTSQVLRRDLRLAEGLRLRTLPSSSPTPGAYVLPLDSKVMQWKEFLTRVTVA